MLFTDKPKDSGSRAPVVAPQYGDVEPSQYIDTAT